MEYGFHALRSAVARTSKAIPRVYRRFDRQELRCKPGKGGIKLPHQSVPNAGSLQRTYQFVCTPLPRDADSFDLRSHIGSPAR